MQKKTKIIRLFAVIVCVLFVTVLALPGAFVANHDCTGEDCVVCMLASSVKYILSLIACAFITLTIPVLTRVVDKIFIRGETLVSAKTKLTI